MSIKWAIELTFLLGLKCKYKDTRTHVHICLTFTIPAATAIILLNLILPLKDAAAMFWRDLFPHQIMFVCIPTGCSFLTKLNIRVWNKASEFHIFYLETFIALLSFCPCRWVWWWWQQGCPVWPQCLYPATPVWHSPTERRTQRSSTTTTILKW